MGAIYKLVDLNSSYTFVRKLKYGSIKKAIPMIDYNWYEFEEDETWELWEDDGDLYYRGQVEELVMYEGFGYVKFKVIGKPQKSSRSD